MSDNTINTAPTESLRNAYEPRNEMQSRYTKTTLVVLAILGIGIGVGLGVYFGGQHLGLSALKIAKNRCFAGVITGVGVEVVLGVIAGFILLRKPKTKEVKNSLPVNPENQTEEQSQSFEEKIIKTVGLFLEEDLFLTEEQIQQLKKTILDQLSQTEETQLATQCVYIFNLIANILNLTYHKAFDKSFDPSCICFVRSSCETLADNLVAIVNIPQDYVSRLDKLGKNIDIYKTTMSRLQSKGKANQAAEALPNPFEGSSFPSLEEIETFFSSITSIVKSLPSSLLSLEPFSFYGCILWTRFGQFDPKDLEWGQTAKSCSEYLYSDVFKDDSLIKEPDYSVKTGVHRLATYFYVELEKKKLSGEVNWKDAATSIAVGLELDANKYKEQPRTHPNK